jgi:hypothetical protein
MWHYTLTGAPEEIRTPDPQIRRRDFRPDGLTFFCKPPSYRAFESQWLAVLLQTRTLASPPRMTTRRSGSPKGGSPVAAMGPLSGELRKCTPLPPRPKATPIGPGADIKGPITVGSDQALVSRSLQNFLDTSDKVVRTEWLV